MCLENMGNYCNSHSDRTGNRPGAGYTAGNLLFLLRCLVKNMIKTNTLQKMMFD
jgi:hypothetical protein